MEPDLPMLTRDRRHQADDIERVILSHTAKRNALSEQLLRELDQTLVAIEAEQRAKVVILAADGPVFSAGHDLRELRYGTEPEVAAVFRTCSAVMSRIRSLSALVIAEVEG
ncbi:MAG: enoyl-CoA hydratase-related protein, partial [Clostridia bacterium]